MENDSKLPIYLRPVYCIFILIGFLIPAVFICFILGFGKSLLSVSIAIFTAFILPIGKWQIKELNKNLNQLSDSKFSIFRTPGYLKANWAFTVIAILAFLGYWKLKSFDEDMMIWLYVLAYLLISSLFPIFVWSFKKGVKK